MTCSKAYYIPICITDTVTDVQIKLLLNVVGQKPL